MGTEVTEQDIKDFMELLKKNDPNFDRDLQDELDFLKLIDPYLAMTKEEMDIAVPHGAYKIGGSGFIGYTGKDGLINVILKYKEQMKLYGTNNT